LIQKPHIVSPKKKVGPDFPGAVPGASFFIRVGKIRTAVDSTWAKKAGAL
jgi:hypothetical protein